MGRASEERQPAGAHILPETMRYVKIYSMKKWEQNVKRWLEYEALDTASGREIAEMMKLPEKKREEELEDRFGQDIAFGTGGLRGKVGAGSNRMNPFSVRRVSQGICDYMAEDLDVFASAGQPSVVIGYDSRRDSRRFAESAAEVFAANGLKVYFFREMCPTACVSFAVRKYGCAMGAMITASHNPAEYNGYKVYEHHGHQVTDEEASRIFRRITALDIFDDINCIRFEEIEKTASLEMLGRDVTEEFVHAAAGASDGSVGNLSVAYSPLCGAGNGPVQKALSMLGISKENSNLFTVRSQLRKDGDFRACSYPNPEKEEAMRSVIALAERKDADLAIATDPDCDRLGVAIRRKNGMYRKLSGNETAFLMLDYLLRKRKERGLATEGCAVARTLVSGRLTDRLAGAYGVRVKHTLTGFKYIGEILGQMSDRGCEDDFLFGFEESCGYLVGSYVREKDAVGAIALLCRALSEAKKAGMTAEEQLDALYRKYGYEEDRLLEFEFDGIRGAEQMRNVVDDFAKEAAGEEIRRFFGGAQKTDYRSGLNGLPPSNMMEYRFPDEGGFFVRPSGTEPKLKIYASALGEDREAVEIQISRLAEVLEEIIYRSAGKENKA